MSPPVTPAYVSHRLHLIAETQVLPRLMRWLNAGAVPPSRSGPRSARPAIDDQIVLSLAAGMARGDRVGCVEVAERHIEDCAPNGCSLLDVLAAAVGHLDLLYTQDSIGLADASLASFTLQFLLQHFKPQIRPANTAHGMGLRMLMVVPDAIVGAITFVEVRLCSEFFQREGWDVQLERDMTSETFRRVVETEWFDLIEVFATLDTDLNATASGIRMIRANSPNPALNVVLRGDPFRRRPSLAGDLGADWIAADAPTSVAQALAFQKRAS